MLSAEPTWPWPDFIGANVDMILSGHLHMSGIGDTTKRYRLPGRAVLLIRAGTATSTRQRGEVNAFNVVRIAGLEVAFHCMIWRRRGDCGL
jgi:hypothetical protein